MRAACIDIGSNTTRLLVGEPAAGRVREVLQQRAFTRIGRELRAGGRISDGKLAEIADVVAAQARVARELGARDIRAVATAAIREAVNRDELVDAVLTVCGIRVEVLEGDEEARLAFLGATRALDPPPAGEIAVVDVGGGSSEIALGRAGRPMRWSVSLRVGSGALADAHVRSDPPSTGELERMRAHAAGCFADVELPRPALGVAVGGSATSLRRLVGPELTPEALDRAMRALASAPARDLARRFGLDPERVRLLPAGILILASASDRLGVPLRIGCGGLREGVLIELLGARERV